MNWTQPHHLRLCLLATGLAACAPTVDANSDFGKTGSTTDGSGSGPEGSGGDDGGGDEGGDDGTTGGGPVDADGDGYPADEDCDDSDPDTHPGAEEIHDGTDNDCDGFTDEIEVCEDGVDRLQDAIDDAPDGATLLLCAGEWAENLIMSGRELTIVGLEGADETIINGSGAGRALTMDGSEVTLSGLSLVNGASSTGGVMVCNNGELTLESSVVRGGVAEDGGGLALLGCDFVMEGSSIEANVASRYGGGLFSNRSRGEVVDSTIDGNTGLEGGGAFTYDGEVDFLRTTISANAATSIDEEAWGPGAGGGGLWSSGGAVQDSTIVGNVSAYSGGGAYFYRGRPELSGTTVDGNACGEDGAGVFFNVSTAVIEGNVFRNNEAADDAGGLRLYFGNSRIEGNEFYDNTANDDGGGAKFSHSEHTFINNYMEGNATGDAGGGLELDNDSTHVADSVFIDNTAYRGAGLHNWRTETRFTIESSVFIGNAAGDCGGGLQFDNSPYLITVYDLWLEGNRASDGAGLCVDRIYRDPDEVGGQENYFQNTLLKLTNIVFTENTASDDGGGIYVKAGNVDIENVVMDGNEGPTASAVAVKGSAVTLTNAIVSNSSGGAALYVEDTEDGIGTLSVTYSNLYRNSSTASGLDDPRGTNGNIDENPDYDTAAGDFSLQSSSPCIDAGNPDLNDPDGSRSDMGAHGGPSAP